MIQLFADLLRSHAQGSSYFVGHIGGDDFFLGVKGRSLPQVASQVGEIINRFKRDVESFYDPDTLRRGCIRARNRKGEEQEFPLLTVSGVLVELPGTRSRIYSADDISRLIATYKKEAKQSLDKLRTCSVCELDDEPLEQCRAHL